MATTYAEFLSRKTKVVDELGQACAATDVHPMLHDWQARITAWAVRKGRAAVWADTGLGKTVMQVEWARLSGRRSLIVAPLAVCEQTVREAAKLGVDLRYVREDDRTVPMMVTNYEMVDRFDPSKLDAVVLDEASILKQSDGKTRTRLIKHFAPVHARLACTATPAPNDPEELTNQAEFLGVMRRVDMLAAYYVHDDNGWRVKGHAHKPMTEWMASWAVAIRRPSDLGYPDGGYALPGLEIRTHLLDAEPLVEDGQLFATTAALGGVGGRAKVRKATLKLRCERAVEIVNASHSAVTGSGTKLAACGSLSTPSGGAPNTRPTQPSESVDAPKAEARTRTASTCASTTATILKSGSAPQSEPNGSTPGGVSATQPTSSTASSASARPGRETRKPSATLAYAPNSESRQPNSTPSSPPRAVAAPSVARPLGTDQVADSPSTTATPAVLSAEYSALPATSASASSATILSSSAGPRGTSLADLEPWVIWCGLNDEQRALERAFGERAISIHGSMKPEEKVALLAAWLRRERPILISKPSMLGLGVNMQHAARMVFVGLSDSYEQYYQCIRRCHRYGQTRKVVAHVVLSHAEAEIAENIARKEREANDRTEALVTAMRSASHGWTS